MSPSRRRFLASFAASLLPIALAPVQAAAAQWRGTGPHPEPRPGIDGSRVLTARQLADTPDVIPYFDRIRQIPQIADGIRCQCECNEIPGFRSLLTCFERDGMAQHCAICQSQATLAHELHRRGRTLKEIRAAIDEAFG